MASMSRQGDRAAHRASTLELASKSIWKERFTKNFSFYCPMCSAPRQIGMHPKPGQPLHFAQVGLTTLVIGMGINEIWPWIGLKAAVAFVPLWIAFELIYRAKIRASVACKRCGFDPVLYLSDIDRTREAIRDHWRKRFEEKGIPFPENDRLNNAMHLNSSHLSQPASEAGVREEDETEA
jgi:hypothetical protein